MDIKTYYKIYRKRPIEEKIDLMLESMRWASINYANAARCDIWHNESDKRYYRDEEHAMYERARFMRGLILQEIKDLNHGYAGVDDIVECEFEYDERYQYMVRMWGRKIARKKYKEFILGQ